MTSSSIGKRQTARRHLAGFTLIELLVVMGIMLVITSLVLARHNQFNGTVLLKNLAYSVGLSIRQAQVYGISGRSISGTVGTKFGVQFTAANPTQYTLFIDTDADGTYDSGESVEAFSIGGGYEISDLCANTGSVDRCSAAGAIDRLTLVFTRPNPDAVITTNLLESYTSATITVRSAQGSTRAIQVTTTGQIAIQ
jgi:prepilin-type N-terminal cleavage/methylation domain-containing protein